MAELAFVRSLGQAAQISNATTFALSPSVTPGAQSIILAICGTDALCSLSSVTDNQGNTWVIDLAQLVGGNSAYYIARTMQDVKPLINTDVVTAHWNTTDNAQTMLLAEVVGIAPYVPAEVPPASNSGSGTAVTSNSITTSDAPELGIFCVNNSTPSNTIVAGGSWLPIDVQLACGPSHGTRVFYQILTSKQAISGAATLGSSATWDGFLQTYLPLHPIPKLDMSKYSKEWLVNA